VLREREIDLVTVGIEEAGAHDGCFEIVMANDERDAPEIPEGALMQPQERLEFLIPHGLFVTVAGVAQGHAKDPRPSPLAGPGVQCRRAAEKVHLAFRAGRTVKHADGPPRGRDRPHEALHGLVARAVPVTPRRGPARCVCRLRPVSSFSAIAMRYIAAANRGRGVEPGERCGRVCVRAGERFGRICPLDVRMIRGSDRW